jgi:hypothetical protein
LVHGWDGEALLLGCQLSRILELRLVVESHHG